MGSIKEIAAGAAVIALGSLPAFGQTPVADHHQHLFSPALAALISPASPAAPVPPTNATQLVSLLDAAGLKRAVVLSTAYIFEQPTRKVDNAYERVRADNDWTSRQVAQYPDRLVGFCGLNPLKDYALDELARCAKDPNLRHGLKLHIGNSGVDYHDVEHVERLRQVFRAANGYRMAIVVHMRASYSQKLGYGRDEALVFLKEVLPSAPDVPVQIAHLAGGGAPADQAAHDALDVLADAVSRRDPGTGQLWFDTSGIGVSQTADELAFYARKIRQIGVQRIVYGADTPSGSNLPLLGPWAALRKLPLSDDEFRTIANNLAPYMR